MHSSTSSFKLGRSFLTFVIVYVLYRSLILLFPGMVANTLPRTADWSLFGIEVALEHKTGDFVALGSSQLSLISLEEPWTRIAIPGRGPVSGVELLDYLEKTPKVAVVETNWLVRPSDTRETLARIGGPFQFSYRHRPSLVLWSALSPSLLRVRREQVDPDDYDQMVNLAKIWHEQIDNEDNRASAIRRLKDLSARGVDLLFVRMPEDESLESLECQVSLLKLLKKEFPPDKYFWIEPGANHPFVTFDGLHLDVESQQAYGKLLNEALRTYLRNNHSKDLSSTLRIKRGAAQRVES